MKATLQVQLSTAVTTVLIVAGLVLMINSNVIFHVCAQTTHVARRPLKLACGIGSRT